MQPPYIIANWKMNLTRSESVTLATAVVASGSKGGSVILCPSFPNISSVADVLQGTTIVLGAQDVSSAERGSFTGEVSAAMLAAVGCRYVIVGHSERRQRFGETNQIIGQKVSAAFRAGLTPILCIGEKRDERDAGQARAVVRAQVSEALAGTEVSAAGLIVAYEPVWAISPNPPARGDEALEMLPVITDSLSQSVGVNAARERCVVIYGGSVGASNVTEFVRPGKFAGALVGRESLAADEFLRIIAEADAAYATRSPRSNV